MKIIKLLLVFARLPEPVFILESIYKITVYLIILIFLGLQICRRKLALSVICYAKSVIEKFKVFFPLKCYNRSKGIRRKLLFCFRLKREGK